MPLNGMSTIARALTFAALVVSAQSSALQRQFSHAHRIIAPVRSRALRVIGAFETVGASALARQAQLTCPEGKTLCEFCPQLEPLCCSSGNDCVQGAGCVPPGYNVCSQACAAERYACSGPCCSETECCGPSITAPGDGTAPGVDGGENSEGTTGNSDPSVASSSSSEAGGFPEDSTCREGTTHCDTCPGLQPDCCGPGDECVQDVGCVPRGRNVCSDACSIFIRSCPGTWTCCGGWECCLPDTTPSVTPTSSGGAGPGDGAGEDPTIKPTATITAEPPAMPKSGNPDGVAGDGSSDLGNSSGTAEGATGAGVSGNNSSDSRDSSQDSSSCVHTSRIHAPVLCPVSPSLPCGTARHVVEVDGSALTYGQLCEEYACIMSEMDVNAVYAHRWEATTHELGDGRVARLTMFSDFCDVRLQTLLHRGLELFRAFVRSIYDGLAVLSSDEL
jgi:hypothetical protein